MFLVAVAWRFLTFTGFSNDHYAHLAMAQQVLMGDVPIRDFADPGWPLTYTLTALGWLVTGKTMATEWVISTAGFAIGAACSVAAAYRLSGSLAIATVVTLIEIVIFPRAYSYPKVLMYAAGAWALLTLAAQPSRRRLLFMAAIIAVAFLFRHDHGLFIGVGSAVCVAIASRGDGVRVVLHRVALLTTATAMFLVPWIVFVVLNGGLFAYLEAGLDYSRAEANATRLDAWPLAGPAAWLFWLYWSVTLVSGVVAARRLPQERRTMARRDGRCHRADCDCGARERQLPSRESRRARLGCSRASRAPGRVAARAVLGRSVAHNAWFSGQCSWPRS